MSEDRKVDPQTKDIACSINTKKIPSHVPLIYPNTNLFVYFSSKVGKINPICPAKTNKREERLLPMPKLEHKARKTKFITIESIVWSNICPSGELESVFLACIPSKLSNV